MSEQLRVSHVKIIRLPLVNASSLHMIIQACKQGIGAVAIIAPTEGSAAASQHGRPADPPVTGWSAPPLSDAGFTPEQRHPDHLRVAVYNTNLPHPSANPCGNGPSDGVPAADFIHFLRQHGLDDRVEGYGIHIYYTTANNIDSALSICGGPGKKPCWLTEWGGFPTTGTACLLGMAPAMTCPASVRSPR